MHSNEDDEGTLTPVITDDGYTFLYIKHNNLYLMGMTKKNANAMVVLSFLYRVVEVFEDYFNELVEESIRDNFVITYELLDEMMDFGYPQSTEAKILKEYICVQERHKFVAKPPVAITNAVSWRGEGIKHKKNVSNNKEPHRVMYCNPVGSRLWLLLCAYLLTPRLRTVACLRMLHVYRKFS